MTRTPPPGQLFETRTGEVHVHRSGQPKARSVVLVNGWSASGLIWGRAWLARLAEQFDVVRIDNRGTGWSPVPDDDFTLDNLAEDVADICGTLGLIRPAVLGFSMGGMVAQRVAINREVELAALVLVGTGPPIPALVPAPEGVLGSMMRRPKGMSASDLLASMWGGLAAPGFADRDPQAVADLVADALAAPTRLSVIAQQWSAIKGFRNPELLSEIDVPTLILHGGDDPLLVVDNARRLADAIRGARLVERPGVGHLVSYEDPLSAHTVADFLAAAPAWSGRG